MVVEEGQGVFNATEAPVAVGPGHAMHAVQYSHHAQHDACLQTCVSLFC